VWRSILTIGRRAPVLPSAAGDLLAAMNWDTGRVHGAAFREGGNMDPMEGLQAAMAAVDAYYKERGIFEGRFGFGVSPALVVIDMAYGWTDPHYAGGSARLDAAVAAIARLLPPARDKGVPVIYTTSPYQEKPQFKSAA